MHFWGITDAGCIRKQNQDTYMMEQLDRNSVICVVCDGMGGAKSGNVASSLAAEVFIQEVKRSYSHLMDREKCDQMLRSAVKLANFTVFDQSQQFEEFSGMGTTLVAVLVRGKKATVVNVGDSRAYAISQEGIYQLSTDHSVVQMMVDRGELTPETAKSYPGKNLITRAVGTEPVVMCDVFHAEVAKGDYVLLCSDGLSNYCTNEVIAEYIGNYDADECADRLISHVIEQKGNDNITLALIKDL